MSDKTPPAIDDLQRTWDQVIGRWLDVGGIPVGKPFHEWFLSYRGSGSQALVETALPEPWFGDLTRTPAMVFLALNPGVPFLGEQTWRDGSPMPDLQSVAGVFSDEIRRAGSYSAWARRFPDWRTLAPSPNTFFTARQRFASDWMENAALTIDDCAGFELYPWHSARFSAQGFSPGAIALEQINRYVIEPVAALGCPFVFGFGKAWFDLLPRLGFEPSFTLSTRAGDTWPGAPKDRVMTVFANGSIKVVAEMHSGGAGPPKRSEVPILRGILKPHLA